DRIVAVLSHRSLNTAAAIMTDHDDVFDLQNIDSELQGCRKIGISRCREIGYIAMNEHLARIEINNFGSGHTAVRAADPEISRPLLADQSLEETRIDEGFRFGPRPVASKQTGESAIAFSDGGLFLSNLMWLRHDAVACRSTTRR